jgi:hypothetical protein
MTRSRCLALALVLVVAASAYAREFVAEADDFKCLTDGTKAPGKHFYISNLRKRKLNKALKKTMTGKVGKGYPVGTILQLFPFEAMAKRGGKFNREGGGWEYFQLNITPDGQTEILKRGTAEVTGLTGTSCQNCHLNLAADHDSICEFVIGVEGLGLTEEIVAAFQASDARCNK